MSGVLREFESGFSTLDLIANEPGRRSSVADLIFEPPGEPTTTVSFGVMIGLVVEVQVDVALPVSVGLLFEVVPPITTLDLPISAGLEAAVHTAVELPFDVGLSVEPATDVALGTSVGLSFEATQDGVAVLGLPVAMPLSFEPATDVSLPISVGFEAEVVPAITTVDLPITARISVVVDDDKTSVDLLTTVGLEFFVAARGSLWLPYEVAEAGSQLLDFSIVATAPEAAAPNVVDGDLASNSLWLTFVSTASQDVTVSLSAAFVGGIEIWTGALGEGPDEVVFLDSSVTPTSVVVPVSAGQRVFMRAHPTSALETGSGTLTWSVTARSADGVLQFNAADEIYDTPGWLASAVTCATAGGTLEFTVDADPTVVFSAVADESGVCVASVWLPEMAAGTHTLKVTDVTSGQSLTETFTVLAAVVPDPGLPTDNPPGPAPGGARWAFQDASPGGETYIFPINPESMSPPYHERSITSDHTVYAGGQQILWEGMPEPVMWQVEGAVETQAHYEALERFHALQRRFYVIDHLERPWRVIFDSLEFTKIRSDNDWANSYVAKFIIVGGATGEVP